MYIGINCTCIWIYTIEPSFICNLSAPTIRWGTETREASEAHSIASLVYAVTRDPVSNMAIGEAKVDTQSCFCPPHVCYGTDTPVVGFIEVH